MRSLAGWLLLGFAVSLAAPAVAAPTKAQCVDANAKGQAFRQDGKLAQSRAALEKCSDSACPAIVRSDCLERLDELERAQPTLVLGVTDAAGLDTTDVTVTLDGAPLDAKLDGKAIPLDPGEHTLVVTLPSGASQSRKVLLKEGEKARLEKVSFAQAATASSPSPSAEAAPRSAGMLIAGFVLAGVGVAGVAAGVGLGVSAISAKGEQEELCPSSIDCPDHAGALEAHDRAEAHGLGSTISFIAGGVLAAAGLSLIIVDRVAAGGVERAASIAPIAGPGVAGLQLTWTH